LRTYCEYIISNGIFQFKLLKNLALCMLVASSAFAAENEKTDKPVRIVGSFYPMYVMALNVVGDTHGVSVSCMTEPFVGCLHDYQLSPENLKTLATADVFVVNGAGMEVFLDKVIKQLPALKTVEASKGIKLEHNENPHVWVSVRAAIQQTKNIAEGLAKADSAHADDYRRNADQYAKRLETLRSEMHAALDGLKHRNIITFHEAFPYFASEFNLNIVGVVEQGTWIGTKREGIGRDDHPRQA
jgi:zinc transport system substrate-binding protein